MPPRKTFHLLIAAVLVIAVVSSMYGHFPSYDYDHRASDDEKRQPSRTDPDHIKEVCEPVASKASIRKLFKTDKEHVNRHDVEFLLNPCHVCSNLPIDLVMCVPVARDAFYRRRVISETWGSYAYDAGHRAILLFFVGTGAADEPPEVEAGIREESERYNDIVMGDFVDSYRNLSLKSVSILKWITLHCPHAKHVLKADADVYVNVPNLVPILIEQSRHLPDRYILGNSFTGAKPNLDKMSKYYTSRNVFSGLFYPTYVSGTSYAMPGLAAKKLLEASLHTPLFWLEDIYITGLCAKRARLVIIHNDLQFYWKPRATGCSMADLVSGHGFTPKEMVRIHTELYAKDLKC